MVAGPQVLIRPEPLAVIVEATNNQYYYMKISLLRILLISIFTFSFAVGNSQNSIIKDTDAARQISLQVSQDFKNNKIAEAFNLIRQYWPLPENEINTLESQTVSSLNLISDRYGKAESIIKVSEQGIKDTGLRETYLLKYENTAIRIIFTYYKNSRGWIINSFKWDSDFDEEFR